jgi:hypothetical protein
MPAPAVHGVDMGVIAIKLGHGDTVSRIRDLDAPPSARNPGSFR